MPRSDATSWSPGPRESSSASAWRRSALVEVVARRIHEQLDGVRDLVVGPEALAPLERTASAGRGR